MYRQQQNGSFFGWGGGGNGNGNNNSFGSWGSQRVPFQQTGYGSAPPMSSSGWGGVRGGGSYGMDSMTQEVLKLRQPFVPPIKKQQKSPQSVSFSQPQQQQQQEQYHQQQQQMIQSNPKSQVPDATQLRQPFSFSNNGSRTHPQTNSQQQQQPQNMMGHQNMTALNGGNFIQINPTATTTTSVKSDSNL